MAGPSWTNRIVGHQEVDPRSLLANPHNYRIHTLDQERALTGAIHEIGFTRSVTVNQRTGRIIDGHLRVTLAIKYNQGTIPVELVDLSEAEEAQALATMDPIAALAGHDREMFAKLTENIFTNDHSIQKLLADLAQGPPLPITTTQNAPVTEAIIPTAQPQGRPSRVSIVGEEGTQTGGSRRSALPLLAIDGRDVMMTPEEVELLMQLLNRYRNEQQTEAGFVGWLCSFVQEPA